MCFVVQKGNPNDYQMLVQIDKVEELTPAGVPRAAFSLPTTGYHIRTTLDSNITQHFYFEHPLKTVLLPLSFAKSSLTLIRNRLKGATVVLSFSVFVQSIALQSAGISFSSIPSSLKFSFTLSNYTFESPQNSLAWHLSFHPTLPLTSVTGPTSAGSGLVMYKYHSSGATTAVRLLTSATIDNTTAVPITISSNGGNLTLLFPSFTSSLQYDPDLSVTVSGSGDGDGDGSLLPLLALLGLVPVLAICLLVIIIIGISTLIVRKKKRRHTLGEDFAKEL